MKTKKTNLTNNIPGFENYYATEDGQIINIFTGRVLKQYDNGYGYLVVKLSNKGYCVTKKVHTLVALAYLGPKPVGKEIDHLDRNSHNNHKSNLQYKTHSENCLNRRPVNNLPVRG